MKSYHISFIVMQSKIRTVVVEYGDNGTAFFVKDIFEKGDNFNFKEHVRKLMQESSYHKSDQPSKVSSSMMSIPPKLLSAVVTGMTSEGSLHACVKLARSMLLDIKKTFLINEMSESDINSCSEDVLIISGGYDDSENRQLHDFILKLTESQFIKKTKPAVVFAGSSSALPFAKVNIGTLTDFTMLPNVLETSFCPESLVAGEDISIKRSSTLMISSDQPKVPAFSFSNSLQKVTEMFCGRYVNKVLSVLITEEYSVVNECSRSAGKFHFKRYGLSMDDVSLKTADLSESLRSIFQQESLPDRDFAQEDLLQIEKSERVEYYRPERIIGISLSGKAGFEKFLDVVSDPDLLRGVIEFVFDRDGVLLASAPMFFEKQGDHSGWLLDASYSENMVSGWIVIPDGTFVKERTCLTVYVSGNEERNEMSFLWGKRYVMKIDPFSVIEIDVSEKVYFEGAGRKKVLKTGKAGRTIVFDLRKERS